MTKHSNGFTVIEIIFVATIALAASFIFFSQKQEIEIIASDNQSKIAINSIYYSLEEVFYPAHKYYPQTINSEVLKSVDPDLFADPNGVNIGDIGSTYTYEPTNCKDDKCSSYTLRAVLQKEAEYIKTSRHN
jgi:type II secretory pathway pseudopilin PulG